MIYRHYQTHKSYSHTADVLGCHHRCKTDDWVTDSETDT